MFQWYAEFVVADYEERLREAARERLVHEALASRPATPGLRGRALVWLGDRLVIAGKHLQAQYGRRPVVYPSAPVGVASSLAGPVAVRPSRSLPIGAGYLVVQQAARNTNESKSQVDCPRAA